MYDKALAREILSQILNALNTVVDRFSPVKTVEDFTGSLEGMEKLDGICMQLIAIGEGLKNIDKVTNNSLLPNYPEINWKGATISKSMQMLSMKSARIKFNRSGILSNECWINYR